MKLFKYYILLLIIILSSCSGGNIHNLNSGCYIIIAIDDITFRDYNSIFLEDKHENLFFLITKKIKSVDSIKNYSNLYEKLVKGKKYCFNLNKIDSVVTLKLKFYSESEFIYEIDDKIIWSKDTVRIETFSSENILDTYLKK